MGRSIHPSLARSQPQALTHAHRPARPPGIRKLPRREAPEPDLDVTLQEQVASMEGSTGWKVAPTGLRVPVQKCEARGWQCELYARTRPWRCPSSSRSPSEEHSQPTE